MEDTARTSWRSYAMTPLAIAMAVLLKLLLDPLIGHNAPFLLAYSAVMFAAWYGGFGPGLLATALAAVTCSYLYLLPLHSFIALVKFSSVVQLIVFVLEGAMVSGLIAAMHGARLQARKSEARFRLMVENVRDYAMFMIDLEGRIESWDGGAVRLMGYQDAEIVGEPFAKLFAPEDLQADEPQHQLATAAKEGRAFGECWHVRKDGSRFWASGVLTLVRDGSGRPLGFADVVRDRTEQKRAELDLCHAKEEAEANERRYRSLAEAVPQMIWTAGPDGRIDYFNQRWYDYAGPAAVLDAARGWRDTLHPDDLQTTLDLWARVVATGEVFEHEIRFRHAENGSYRWHLVRAVPVAGRDGGIAKWVGTCTDIDDRKRAEGELKEAKEAAESASQAKDAFLAALSHELRTPLTPTLMSVSALELDASLSPELRGEIGMIRRNVAMEARLIDDLLDLTRIAKGKLGLNVDRVEVHGLIEHVQQICGYDLKNKRQTLTLALNAERHLVQADAARLQQVLWNLVKNAVKFTPEGGNITLATMDVEDDRLRIEVVDSGIGIMPELMPRIFDAFEQGGRSITQQFGGLGLGLAISKTIVEAHGGSIAASSRGKNAGTTFTVELKDAEYPTESAEISLNAEERPPSQRLRILLVDDHEDTLHVTSRILSRLGHHVGKADSIASAIELASTDTFDVLVSDLGLPDGSGLELLERLRPIPGIALTGYGMEDDMRKTHEAGFLAHLTKPIDFQHLEDTIQRVAAIALV
jgi:PAS domain S-box-containing protein